MTKTLQYQLSEVIPYINWLYFFHAWQFPASYGSLAHIHQCAGCRTQWINQFTKEEQPRAREAMKLFDDATHLLETFSKNFHTNARFSLLPAHSDGDDLLIYTQDHCVRFPVLRQQHEIDNNHPNLSLADFIRPLGREKDRIGLFAATVEQEMEDSFLDDSYRHLLTQTICDRLAEATAELLHTQVRQTFWGFAPNEKLTPEEMFQGHYQGIRPAVGYPSLPDQSVNFIIDQILNLTTIGIQLTESGAMKPHGSVSGLIFAHPQARYFSIGKIGQDQFLDYAQRRNMEPEQIKKFLTANL